MHNATTLWGQEHKDEKLTVSRLQINLLHVPLTNASLYYSPPYKRGGHIMQHRCHSDCLSSFPACTSSMESRMNFKFGGIIPPSACY